MNEASILYGRDLIHYQQYIDFADGFANLLDPQGINVVTMEVDHADGDEMRLEMLFKLINREEPHEGNLTIPYVIYKQI